MMAHTFSIAIFLLPHGESVFRQRSFVPGAWCRRARHFEEGGGYVSCSQRCLAARRSVGDAGAFPAASTIVVHRWPGHRWRNASHKTRVKSAWWAVAAPTIPLRRNSTHPRVTSAFCAVKLTRWRRACAVLLSTAATPSCAASRAWAARSLNWPGARAACIAAAQAAGAVRTLAGKTGSACTS